MNRIVVLSILLLIRLAPLQAEEVIVESLPLYEHPSIESPVICYISKGTNVYLGPTMNIISTDTVFIKDDHYFAWLPANVFGKNGYIQSDGVDFIHPIWIRINDHYNACDNNYYAQFIPNNISCLYVIKDNTVLYNMHFEPVETVGMGEPLYLNVPDSSEDWDDSCGDDDWFQKYIDDSFYLTCNNELKRYISVFFDNQYLCVDEMNVSPLYIIKEDKTYHIERTYQVSLEDKHDVQNYIMPIYRVIENNGIIAKIVYESNAYLQNDLYCFDEIESFEYSREKLIIHYIRHKRMPGRTIEINAQRFFLIFSIDTVFHLDSCETVIERSLIDISK